MLTARGTTLLVGAAIAWAVGRALGIDELYIVAVASAALVAAAVVGVRLSTSSVSVRRTVSAPRLMHGSTADVTLELRNDARLPAPVLLVTEECPQPLAEQPRFVIPGLRPGRAVVSRYQLMGAARGRYRVGPLSIRTTDSFGLAQRTRRYHSTAEVLVYPRIEPLGQRAARGAHHGTGSSEVRRLFNSGDEFYTMREYVQGDDLRQVHWPSTAHRQTLMVRQMEQPWQAQATVFCDTRSAAHRGAGPTSTLEKAISLAASVIWYLADHGYQLRLVTAADHRSVAVEHWDALLDRLAEITATAVPGIGPALQRARGGEGLLVAVVAAAPGTGPLAREPDVRAMIQTGRAFATRVALVTNPGGAEARRAEELAGLLRGAGWRAATVAAGQNLGDRWPDAPQRRPEGRPRRQAAPRADAQAPLGGRA